MPHRAGRTRFPEMQDEPLPSSRGYRVAGSGPPLFRPNAPSFLAGKTCNPEQKRDTPVGYPEARDRCHHANQHPKPWIGWVMAIRAGTHLERDLDEHEHERAHEQAEE